jgi:hypothetical protein
LYYRKKVKEDFMERITLEVDEDAGKKWRSASPQLKSDLIRSIEMHIIKVVEANKIIDSYALPSEPLCIKVFQDWIREAEKNDSISMIDAKKKWARKRTKLEKPIR